MWACLVGMANVDPLLKKLEPVHTAVNYEGIFFLFFFKSQPPYQGGKKKKGLPEVGVSEEGVCCKIVFL